MEPTILDHKKHSQARRSRFKAQAACNRCRRLRAKCNTARPSCNLCTVTGSLCEYDTIDPSESRFSALRRENESLQEQVVELAKSMQLLAALPEQDAVYWIKLLQSARNPVQLLRTLNSGISGGAQATGAMSAQNVSSACLPPHRSLPDMELAESTPAIYPLTDPALHSDLVDSMWWDCIGQQSVGEGSEPSKTSQTSREAPQSATNRLSYGPATRFIPGPKFTFHDTRLRSLVISDWTSVPISNQSAAMVISLYLQYEHDGFGFFDPELFVRDLVSKRTTFCSSFLVNSLLSWAFRTYGFVDAESSTLGSMCFDSARELLQTEGSVDSILNVASLAILGLGANGGGHPILAATFLVGCVHMGERMGLFGESRAPEEAFGFVSDDARSQCTWVAWGAFNLSVIETWYFRGKAIGMLATRPPLLPMPHRRNNDPEHHHEYAEHEPPLMPAFCGLFIILHDILMVYHEEYAPIPERVPLAFAEAKFSQLMAWSAALPPVLARKEDLPHNVAILHIVFHAIITDVFRPFRQLYVQSMGFQFQYRIGDIFDCSTAQLRSLSVDFYYRFKSTPATHSVSWITAILWGANGVMVDSRMNRQADIVFFVQASANLLSSHPVMDRFVRGLLAMAVAAEILSLEQARQVLKRLKRTITTNNSGIAGWVTDLNRAMENPQSAVADVLAQHFDEMSLEQGVSA